MENKGILRTEKGFYCYIDQKYYVSLKSLVRRLRTLGTNSKDYYDNYLGNIGKCQTCGNTTRFKTITTGYSTFCSYNCVKSNKNHMDKVKKIVSQRFVGEPEKRQKALDKYRDSMATKTKEELTEIYQRRIETVKTKYGEDYPSRKAKLQWERRTQEEIKALVEKANATKQRNGTSYTPPYKTANREITIGDRTFKVQGYEDIALSLITEIVDVSKIKIGKDVPKIFLPTGRKYYPDICIDDLLIEVKSEYTYSLELKENLIKQQESIKAGFRHIILVIHSKDITKNRTLKDKNKYLNALHKAISNQASNEEGSTTIHLLE